MASRINSNDEPTSSDRPGSGGKLRACGLCKSKKKRCTHRGGEHAVVSDTDIVMETRFRKRTPRENQIAENTTSKITSATASTPSTLSSLSFKEMDDSDDRPCHSCSSKNSAAEFPVAGDTSPTTRAIKAAKGLAYETSASMAIIPELSTDAMQGSIAMSVHSVFAGELQRKLDDLETKVQASVVAHQATQESAQSVRDTVQAWVDAWTSGQ